MIGTFGNGNKGKFDQYAQNMFIMGTMKKNWEQALLNQWKESNGLDTTQVPATVQRVLAESDSTVTATQKKAMDNPVNFSNFIKEIKFWIYLASWLIKIYILFRIPEIRNSKTFKLGEIKFINITRKIHFLLFNLTIIDVFYTGTRGLFHIKAQKILSL
jgi:hypothetical protein